MHTRLWVLMAGGSSGWFCVILTANNSSGCLYPTYFVFIVWRISRRENSKLFAAQHFFHSFLIFSLRSLLLSFIATVWESLWRPMQQHSLFVWVLMVSEMCFNGSGVCGCLCLFTLPNRNQDNLFADSCFQTELLNGRNRVASHELSRKIVDDWRDTKRNCETVRETDRSMW